MAKNKINEKPDDALKIIQTRLDTIVLLLLNSTKSDGKTGVSISDAAPLLHSAGYTPTEIAKLFGKKKAQDVAQYIYKKNKKV